MHLEFFQFNEIETVEAFCCINFSLLLKKMFFFVKKSLSTPLLGIKFLETLQKTSAGLIEKPK